MKKKKKPRIWALREEEERIHSIKKAKKSLGSWEGHLAILKSGKTHKEESENLLLGFIIGGPQE